MRRVGIPVALTGALLAGGNALGVSPSDLWQGTKNLFSSDEPELASNSSDKTLITESAESLKNTKDNPEVFMTAFTGMIHKTDELANSSKVKSISNSLADFGKMLSSAFVEMFKSKGNKSFSQVWDLIVAQDNGSITGLMSMVDEAGLRESVKTKSQPSLPDKRSIDSISQTLPSATTDPILQHNAKPIRTEQNNNLASEINDLSEATKDRLTEDSISETIVNPVYFGVCGRKSWMYLTNNNSNKFNNL